MEVIENPPIEFKCLEAEQPIGTVYIGVMNHDDLEHISFADVRRLELGNDNREVEDYIGIQRQLNTKREKDIGKYVNLVDATFPNSVIAPIQHYGLLPFIHIHQPKLHEMQHCDHIEMTEEGEWDSYDPVHVVNQVQESTFYNDFSHHPDIDEMMGS